MPIKKPCSWPSLTASSECEAAVFGSLSSRLRKAEWLMAKAKSPREAVTSRPMASDFLLLA